jgi:hypothetical protein
MPAEATVSPPLAPGFHAPVVLVLDDLGAFGRVYRETQESEADLDTVINRMIEGQYERPIRVVEFNTAEGWARDRSEDVAREVAARAKQSSLELPHGTKLFVQAELGDRIAAAD